MSDADLEMIDLRDAAVDDWRGVLGEPTLSARDFVVSSGQYDRARHVQTGETSVRGSSWGRVKSSFGD